VVDEMRLQTIFGRTASLVFEARSSGIWGAKAVEMKEISVWGQWNDWYDFTVIAMSSRLFVHVVWGRLWDEVDGFRELVASATISLSNRSLGG
jgi:hypothetical protein